MSTDVRPRLTTSEHWLQRLPIGDIQTPDDGVLRRRDATTLYGAATVRRLIDRGTWTQPHPRVVVMHNGPLSWRQRVWLAVLTAPDHSLVAGLTALHLDGFTGFETTRPHILIPARGRRPSAGFAIIHRTEVLPDSHVSQRNPPRTTPARALIDAAAWAGSERQARAVVLAVIRQRRVTVDAALAALDVRLVTRRQRVIGEAIRDAAGGIESLPEHDFARLTERARLPRPRRQRTLVRPSGTFYLDADYEEYGLAVEIDGVPHTDVQAGENDAQREHELVIEGRRVLRFSAWLVRHQPQYVARVLADALRAGGWTGTPAPWVHSA